MHLTQMSGARPAEGRKGGKLPFPVEESALPEWQGLNVTVSYLWCLPGWQQKGSERAE